MYINTVVIVIALLIVWVGLMIFTNKISNKRVKTVVGLFVWVYSFVIGFSIPDILFSLSESQEENIIRTYDIKELTPSNIEFRNEYYNIENIDISSSMRDGSLQIKILPVKKNTIEKVEVKYIVKDINNIKIYNDTTEKYILYVDSEECEKILRPIYVE
jgi:hypothetical protein